MTDLYNEFQDFSGGSFRFHPDRPDMPLFPTRNARYTWNYALQQILARFLNNDRFLMTRGLNLGQIVAMEIDTNTRDGFSWQTVVGIIGANFDYICMDHARGVDEMFPGSLLQLGVYGNILETANFKHVARLHAKTLLWLEALSFLVLKNYDQQLVE